MWKIVIHKRVHKYYLKLPTPLQHAVKEAFVSLQRSPLESDSVRAMSGDWAGWYRMRQGNLRIIFWLSDEDKTIYIDHLGPRGDVYKK